MTDRINWELGPLSMEHLMDGTVRLVSAMAQGAVATAYWPRATASAEMLLIDPTEYGVPFDVPQERVFRFSRVKANPPGKGGGAIVLKAVLDEMDRHGLWAVLEASPYAGQDEDELYAFYERHGFQHCPDDRGIMFRPPAATS